MINNYTVYTARELRNGISRLRAFFGNLAREDDKHRKKVFDDAYTKIVAEKDMDKLEYLYFFITRIAWLGQEVTNQDDVHFKKGGEATQEKYESRVHYSQLREE